MKENNLGLIDLYQAHKVIDKFLEDKQEIKFKANFPVCEIINYIEINNNQWRDIDSNDSGSCHDMWFIYKDFTVMICTYHGDVYLQNKGLNNER